MFLTGLLPFGGSIVLWFQSHLGIFQRQIEEDSKSGTLTWEIFLIVAFCKVAYTISTNIPFPVTHHMTNQSAIKTGKHHLVNSTVSTKLTNSDLKINYCIS